MFYSQFILAKKGPLGTIWIAAHLERKLRKNQVADTDIGVSVDSILCPDVPIALRLSSHLLLGVVRIYNRKVNYLFDDCSDALLKVKQAFRSAAVDMPPEESSAPYHSITLPETFDLDDFELPGNETFQGNYVDHHISTREQITLQDTMDGAVFSTSQFGLDERFGDGDTSQINLDIDEKLLLGKNAALWNESNDGVSGANIEVSAQPMTPCEEDENNEEMVQTSHPHPVLVDNDNQPGGLPTSAEFNEYAQAPSTPGLVQEPNLSNAQKVLIIDDHLEVEVPNSSDLTIMETTENACGKPEYHNEDKDGAKCSLYNDSTHDAIEYMPPETNGYHSRDMEIQLAKSPEGSHSELVKHIPSVPELSGGIGAMASSNELPNENNGLSSYNNLNMPSVDRTVGEWEDSTVRLEEAVASPSCSHVMSDFEKTQSLNKTVVLSGGADVDLETERHPAIHEEATSEQMHVLRPCSQRDTSSLGGEHHPATGEETVEDCGKLDEQEDNLIASDNLLENTITLATSDLPAPEQLLSAPEDLHVRACDLIVASTPEKEVLEGDDGLATGSKLISGRKRSLTESTITVESMYSVETFGVTKSKRTAESIPDDDDLLSSILGARRSSVLKMKPTPLLEITSTKRTRTAQRPSALKRKVLMDDTMVLHGDTICQQLTNTEDIRRMRKKAPCTRPEILMIQRQFLEDEIFTEPIFTGMSAKLIWLHCEKYELSGITISENDENHTSAEVAKDVEYSIIPSATEDSEPVLGHDVEAQPAEKVQNENQLDNECLCPPYFDTSGQTNSITDVAVLSTSQHETFGDATEMEIDAAKTEATDAANLHERDCVDVLRASLHETLGDPTEMEIDTARTEANLHERDCVDVFQENHALHLSADINVDTQPGSVDTSIVDDVKVSNELNVADMVVENELEDTDNFFIEEKGDGSVEIKTDGHSQPIGQLTDQIENDVEIPNEDGVLAPNVNLDNKDPTSNCTCSGDPTIDSTHAAEHSADAKDNSLNVDEHSAAQKADLQNDFSTETGGFDPSMAEYRGFENIELEIDTDFLNVDDDDVVEDDDNDGMDGVEKTRLLENSGWSSRTRAVAKYLETLFEKEAEQHRKVLPMDNLLVGKTRKEASRMFFETLVLTTKDYIQVEQVRPFDNINIKPRGKLMKSNF